MSLGTTSTNERREERRSLRLKAKAKLNAPLKPRKEGTGRRLEEKSPFAISE